MSDALTPEQRLAKAIRDGWAPGDEHCPQCAYRRAQIEEPERYGVADDRDALKARVAELSTEHLHLSHEVEALEEWNFWLSRTLRDMARRATGLRQNARRAVSREMGYRLSSGETVAEMRHRQTMGELRAERLKARVDLLTTALTDWIALEDEDPEAPWSFWNTQERSRRRIEIKSRARAALSPTKDEV